MAETYWTKDGKYIVDSSGKFIKCDHCPCSPVVFNCSDAPNTLSVYSFRYSNEKIRDAKLRNCTQHSRFPELMVIEYDLYSLYDPEPEPGDSLWIVVGQDGKMRVGEESSYDKGISEWTYGGVNFDWGDTSCRVTWPKGSVTI